MGWVFFSFNIVGLSSPLLPCRPADLRRGLIYSKNLQHPPHSLPLNHTLYRLHFCAQFTFPLLGALVKANIYVHVVIGCYFCSHFLSIFNPTSLTFLTPPFSFMSIILMFLSLMPHSHSQTDDKNTIQLVQPVTDNLIYFTTDILKQSCSSLT